MCTQLSKQVKQLDRVIIRFAGDSGDGMQLTGDRFTSDNRERAAGKGGRQWFETGSPMARTGH